MYLICFYAPPSHVEQIKQAMFAAGAGKLGHYSSCAWQTLGEGEFMPLTGSQPYKGCVNQTEKAAEYKVEMICEQQYLFNVISVMKREHPYEMPAYQVIKTEDV